MSYNVKHPKVLVTGGKGFLGSHLLEELVRQNYDVRSLTKNIFKRDYWLDKNENLGIEFIEGDVRDEDSVTKAMNGVNLVYHLAAQGSPNRSIQNPYETNEINVLGTINVLNSAMKENVDKILYMSTSEVYGNAQYIPMDEKHPLNPRTPYAASKLGAERNCYAFHQTYGLPIVIIRSFNFFGPRQRIGSQGGVISNFIYGMLRSEPIVVSGDGSQTRDFLYVEDVVKNLVKSMENSNANADPINFATESEISINQIVDMIKDITKSRSSITYGEARPGDVSRLCGSNKKAIELIGFKLDHTFEQGLIETIEWHRKFSPQLDKIKIPS